MINTLIVDDEVNGVEVLSSLISLHCPDINVVGSANSVQQARELIDDLNPDLIFLDIQMPGENGFDLLKGFGDNFPFKVIFVTSYDQYALNAIKFSALDYLLKPIDTIDLKQAVSKAVQLIREQRNTDQLMTNLLTNLNDELLHKSLVVHERDKVHVVRFIDVEYILSEGRYSKLFLMDGRHFVLTRNLKEFEDYFDESSPLLRINKSVIINTKYLKTYTKGEPCFIEMLQGATFEVSRRRKQEILLRLKS